MRKLAFVPTTKSKPYKEGDNLIALEAFFNEAGFEFITLENKASIFEAYDEAVREHVSDTDVVIFCHDDIEILSNTVAFNTALKPLEGPKQLGFFGVAGTRVFGKSGMWWNEVGKIPLAHSANPLSGQVFTGANKEGMYSTMYGIYGAVSILDGVLLAAQGKTLKQLNLKQPKSFSGGWDYYDVFYTHQTYKKKLENRTVPIILRHDSPGEMKQGWYQNREVFLKVLDKADKLPISL